MTLNPSGNAPTITSRTYRKIRAKQRIDRAQLTIHADRGSSMTSKPVAFLLADLVVTQSHSRPQLSNDNAPHDPGQGTFPSLINDGSPREFHALK
ncbi:hypothetical protein MBOT_01090 [Mycobacterium botniense]|uniref:Uncharacterized protein n=1 Tax=Mycobacterium botniense TaxID=84962 RepID=A0A7I9XS22_9MYCO|nr:hypothetical protein MBOT_01090 [Mycobacterium botniense]